MEVQAEGHDGGAEAEDVRQVLGLRELHCAPRAR